ncbi:protein disulfide-isomerase precursor [Coemansia asiatica]|uniref:protein disulfide-isomerase n=1 Tax=Coemansia asiatica TaxID=1052880 RepID=A0A9W7XHH0_9FUNG|nr:protein disulfide-isomerase precursor [Coemansia asiatica]
MKLTGALSLTTAVAAWAASGLVATVFAESAESAVKVLTNNDFLLWSKDQSLALVEFYAPWCGYCQAMAPAYEMAASALKKDKIPLAKVDCTTEITVCDDMGIEGFPTLKVVKGGMFAPYNGTRQEASIVSYMRKHSKPALQKIKPVNFDNFIDSGHIVVVGFADDNANDLAALKTVAEESFDEYLFGYVSDKSVAKKFGVPYPGIAVFKDFDTRKDIYEFTRDADKLRLAIRSSSIPVLGELSAQTFGSYVRSGIPIGLLFYDSQEMRQELQQEFLVLAVKYKQDLSLALVDARIYHKHAKSLNLQSKWPAFAIQEPAKHLKYLFPHFKVLTAEKVDQFVSEFVSGKLEPNFKSQPIPAKNDAGVFELVAKQFNDVVFDRSKDVLIEFYAPWCIYCKRMAKAYADLGDTFKENPNMVIAKMDATANDIPSGDPGFQFPGFPTVVLVRAGDNAIIRYNGDRTLSSMIGFIKKHAIHSSTYEKPEAIEKIGEMQQHVYIEAPKDAVGYTPKETRHIEL